MRQVSSRIGRRASFVTAAGAAVLAIVLAGCAAGATPTTAPGSNGPGASSAVPSTSPDASVTASPTPPASSEASIMATPSPSPSPAPFSLASTAFAEGSPIPRESSCHGADVSPPLAWHGIPDGSSALVLFVDDPDGHDWVHWIVLDLPAADGDLPSGVAPSADPPQQGRNDFGNVGYGGPCPPSGKHHYRFTLYALAAPLGLSGHPAGAEVRAALGRATVLGTVTLTGTYRA
jgi:Raf kinase inhibitor-like YbhB/YbcL family protein